MSSTLIEHSATNLHSNEDADDLAIWDSNTCISIEDDERSITELIDSEIDHLPKSDYFQRIVDHSIDPISRQDSINWILKVHDFHRFRPVTAYLSINYLDRFLSSYTLPRGSNGWQMQLLSVACLSLAAKMEEINVPLLLELQVLEPKFIFEPKTVGRMEVLVMSKLKWRLNSVTPFDYIDYFVSKVHFLGSRVDNLNRVFSRVSDLILKTFRVIDFLGYPPSVMAAAAVLLASGECVKIPVENDREPEVVRGCHQLMEEYLTDMCPCSGHKHESSDPESPNSPVGVLDAASCKSCESSHKSGLENTEPSQAEPEPSNKRQRLDASDV